MQISSDSFWRKEGPMTDYFIGTYQKIPGWLIKNKINEQTKLKQTHRYRKQTDHYQKMVGGLGEKGDRIKNYKLGFDQGAQLVRVSLQYTKGAGSIPSQGTYKNQLMNA